MFVLKLSGKFFENPNIVKHYANIIRDLVNSGKRFVVVVGGGRIARTYVEYARYMGLNEAQADMLGIEVSRINALLLAYAIGSDVVYIPIPRSIDDVLSAWSSGKLVVMGGLQPGQSTAGTAAVVAEVLGIPLILYATDVDGVYDKDPKRFPDAKLLRRVSYEDLEKILSPSQSFEAGGYQLIDPIALRIAKRARIKIVIFNGTDPHNVIRALSQDIGTVVEG